MADNYIEIADENSESIIVNKGNFSFIYKYDNELFRECHEAERNIYIDPAVALQKFRNSIEKFAIHTEADRRIGKNTGLQFGDVYDGVKRDIDEYSQHSSKNTSGKATAKWYFISSLFDLSRIKKHEFDKIYRSADESWSIRDEWEAEEQSGQYTFSPPKALGRKLYAITSNSSHNSMGNCEDAVVVAKILLWIYAVYFGENVKFNESLVPIMDYYPIRRKICEDFFKLADREIKLYVSETESGIHYHLLRRVVTDDNTCRRSLEISNSLWGEMKTDNVLVNYSEIGQKENKILVLNLPAKPMSLSKALSEMTRNERQNVALNILSIIRMLHTSDPVIVHRALSPMDFIVFQKRSKSGVFLYNFNTAKQRDIESEYTVIGEISNNNKRSRYMAHEIIEGNYETQWLDRADIYSLGKIIPDILDNEDKMLVTDLIERMCSHDYTMRPDINTVYVEMNDTLKSGFRYLAGTYKSPKRKQQDAFFISGYETVQADEISYEGKCRKTIMCAVFDGLGGGQAGGSVSRLCAEATKEFWMRSIKSNYRMVLERYVRLLQDSVLRYMDEECYDYAGTTMAAVIAEGKKIYIANAGDARVHLINSDGIEQLSYDHRFTRGIVKQKELYQYIGMDESDGKLIPYIEEFDFKEGDYLLISSDGLTDYADGDAIRKIVLESTDNDVIMKLKELARDNGSKDDITAILIKGE